MASYFVGIYLATAVPAVVAGVLAQLATLSVAFLVFAYVVIAIWVAGLAGLIMELRFRAANSCSRRVAAKTP